MMHRKIGRRVAILGLAFLLLLLTGCGAGNWQNPSSSTPSSEPESAPAEIGEADVEDTLEGLVEYLKGSGFLSGDGKEMAAEIIGAKAGLSFAADNVAVELYEFDLEQLNDTAKAVCGEIRETGKFSVLSQEVDAVLSDSEKYLMIYRIAKENEDSLKQKEAALKAFKTFKAAA